jgi:subtilisin family serine protease
VGAFNISNVLAGFSSRGPVIVDGSDRLKPDICGPGVDVRSTLRIDDDAYGTLSGTSMSGPHVVGAVALFLNVWPDLIGNVPQIRSVFEVTANPDITVSPPQTCGGTSSDEIPNNSFGWGRVDVLAAVNGCCSPGR